MALPRLRRRTGKPARADRRPAPGAEGWGLEEGDELVDGVVVLRTLGGGRLHEALLVWDARRYALMVAKALRPAVVADTGALRALRREAEALAALEHPAIVRCFDAALEGPRPHLLLEHLEGPPLRRLIRRGGPLPLEQLVPLALHLAAALHFLATRGWVHLDVKPDNVIVGLPPRLIDLSLARPVARARRLAGPAGTDAYMAPEQCLPERLADRIGPATDVFGLGATLFQAAAGTRPFPRPEGARDADDRRIRFPQLAADPAPLPPRTPPELAELLAAMLARDPAARPSAAEVVERLEPLAERLPRRLVLSPRGARGR